MAAGTLAITSLPSPLERRTRKQGSLMLLASLPPNLLFWKFHSQLPLTSLWLPLSQGCIIQFFQLLISSLHLFVFHYSCMHSLIHDLYQISGLNIVLNALGRGSGGSEPVPDHCWARTVWLAVGKWLAFSTSLNAHHRPVGCFGPHLWHEGSGPAGGELGWAWCCVVTGSVHHGTSVLVGLVSWTRLLLQALQTCWRLGQLCSGCRKCQNNESSKPGGLGTPIEISPVCFGMFSRVDLASDLLNTLKIVFT